MEHTHDAWTEDDLQVLAFLNDWPDCKKSFDNDFTMHWHSEAPREPQRSEVWRRRNAKHG